MPVVKKPAVKKPTRIEWMCSQCGTKVQRSSTLGRPMPGVCPRKANKGPHSWIKNREV